jgi:hypothetical protein
MHVVNPIPLSDLICNTFPYPCPTWTSSSGAKVAKQRVGQFTALTCIPAPNISHCRQTDAQ